MFFRNQELQRIVRLASRSECTGCNACVTICPKACIQMKEDKEGFLQPVIDTKSCIKCHKCERVCPVLTPESGEEVFETKAYAVYNPNDEVRKKSSSGGVFYTLAEWILKQGGVVFGARFDDKWEVTHDYTETLEGLVPFMGSKYVQSRIGDAYKRAKVFLEKGRWVLFSGTPCQLGGLRTFLGREYDRLLQVDIICYGVPSPGVWRTYIKERQKRNGEIKSISFRDKREGWRHSHFVVSYDLDHEELDGLFMKGFSYKAYLRECCYECGFRRYHRNSDLTIADYWGVHKLCEEMFDDKGTSIVFSHSSKGVFALNAISDSLIIKPQTKQNAIEYNPFMVKAHSITDKRDRFFRMYRLTSSFEKSSFVIIKDSLRSRVGRRLKEYILRLS